ncbi:homoserine dehydrogenase [Leptospira ryugenii]|uniref:Homoserine dehydrogenase n=1 Tax=Leptospira ryugenii TaxID=1917863 RepID=A0A2P2E336_9LEPT|nr:homoserine dehydrogenase [Leptospira ryugenii]GBF51281.1 homoserine dehydrogenase [Leptospira ryugenii]
MKQIRLGLVGAGVVGSNLLNLLDKKKAEIERLHQIQLQMHAIATRTPSKIAGLTKLSIGTDPLAVANDPNVDILIELMGGTTSALEVVQTALKNGKSVITANKALLSDYGDQIFQLAEEKGKFIGFEAAVAGSIPIIRSLRNGLAACDFEVVCGILNGTTNFILTKMEEENWDYEIALKKAQELGFAEADPTFDVEGIDAAHKISLLASLAFRNKISFRQLSVEGISKLKYIDITACKSLGYRIKLLGIAKKYENGILAKVHPTLIPLKHPLANVMNESNAVFYKSQEADAGMMTGKGAGGTPTASAVLSDIIYYGSKISEGSTKIERNFFPPAQVPTPENNRVRYYLRFSTIDRPGVLSEIARILGKNNISIASVQQKESESEPVNVIVVTHEAKEGDFQKSIQEIDDLKSLIKEKTVAIRLLEHL